MTSDEMRLFFLMGHKINIIFSHDSYLLRHNGWESVCICWCPIRPIGSPGPSRHQQRAELAVRKETVASSFSFYVPSLVVRAAVVLPPGSFTHFLEIESEGDPRDHSSWVLFDAFVRARCNKWRAEGG